MSLVLIRRLTEMSIRNFSGSKAQPARKVDYVIAVCKPIAYKIWTPRVSKPHGPPRPGIGM
jgi:hypothetical protein